MSATHYHQCDADTDRPWVWLPIAIDPATIDAMNMSPRSPCFICEAVASMMDDGPIVSSVAKAVPAPPVTKAVSLDTLPLDQRLSALAKFVKAQKAPALVSPTSSITVAKASIRRDTGPHTCHAMGCAVRCPPRFLMCLKHWKSVPRSLQQRVLQAYVQGQEIRKDPTDEYMEAMKAAVHAVAVKEGRIKVEPKRRKGPHPNQLALIDVDESEGVE